MNSYISVSDHTPVLTSWKEIASHLGKGVRTVQRWERGLGLPVRRPNAAQKHVVIAFPEELDNWLRSRLSPRSQAPKQRSNAASAMDSGAITLELTKDARLHLTNLRRLLGKLRQNRSEQGRLRRELAERRNMPRRRTPPTQ